MLGCLRKVIKTVIIIFAIIGFAAVGGFNLIKEQWNIHFGNKQENKVEKAEKIADFSKINGEFEIVSTGSIPFTGDYVYAKHTASEQKFLFFNPKNQKTLTQEDFYGEQTTVVSKINDFVNKFNILGFKFENFKTTGKGSLHALNQNIPFVKFQADISNLPIKGTQGIIGAIKIKNEKNAILIVFNTQGKYSQIITSVFLSEVQISK